ncbi:GNAT family N-acetyltransferase [Paenibacillus sacheonensis]|uniref:GNAT family N-acetyltransferase n=2 Tax=Paenibacillus sacheonensis TaxID=742054 RepID=A0A7X4YNA7_9BACL|nr:GNAT family N-acetyltransferase [Paenibacillus sacheonensis]NBC69532.1 GNAT family N-acetyltransferase [Paenibacillus sacheonensis]
MSARWLNAKGIFQWRPEYFHLDQVTEFMADGAHVYLAYWNDAVVGTYTITWSDPLIWKELDSPDAGYIHRFAVHRDYEGQGLGGHLLHAAEEQIRQEGKTLVRLDCMADNARLNQYYREMGYAYIRRLDAADWSASLYEKR